MPRPLALRVPNFAALLAAAQAPFGALPPDAGPSVSPLVCDAAEMARARRIALFVPGALTSTAIFGDPGVWRAAGYAPAFYRLPGMDGLPADHALRIDDAAALIAARLDASDADDILLVGYSTGAPIVLTAARRMRAGRRVRLALIAPAVERAGGIETGLRGAAHMLAAAARARSLDPGAIWPAYCQTLLFGPVNRRKPHYARRIADLAAAGVASDVPSGANLVALHTRDLRRWTLPPGAATPRPDIRTAIFAGDADPVFSARQTRAFARAIGGAEITFYPGDGHLPMLTRAGLTADIAAFAERDG